MKTRLDVLLVDKGLIESREKARAAIMEGIVYVNGALSDKPGTPVKDDAEIEIRGELCPFVRFFHRRIHGLPASARGR